MFSRKFRLPSQTSFLHGKTIPSTYFIFKVIKNDLSYNRYGFVVSKKIDKRATERNRLKRRFRACVENIQTILPQGNDMLFVLRPNAKEKITEELRNEVEKVLKKNVL